MTAAVDIWSSPTTIFAGGIRQLPAALGSRPALLIADAGLTDAIAATTAVVPEAAVVRVSLDRGADEIAAVVRDAVAAHGSAVPVALGGGSIMDVVRLAALAAVDPRADGFAGAVDGLTVLPSRARNPVVCIPSTLGTASEVSPVVVRMNGSGSGGAAMIVSPGLRSAASIIDPTITAGLSIPAQAAGLVEPLARVCVPAISGEPLPFQDGLAAGLTATILELGDLVARQAPDDQWRAAAALASIQTHLALTAVGRTPAGHLLWPLATELIRATGASKAVVLAALLPAWLRAIAAGELSPAWGTGRRVARILGGSAARAADRMAAWLRGLGLPTRLPVPPDPEAIADRVVTVWQATGLFLHGVSRAEISSIVGGLADE